MSSRGINKVILIGYLGQNPEIRYMSNGNAVTNITIATSDVWKNKQTGEQKEKTEWHKIVIFGKLAEIVNEYLRKGSQIYIEGSLQTRKWLDKSGIERFTTEIIVNMNGCIRMLGSKKNSLKKENWNEIKKNEEKNISENDINQSSINDESSIDFDDEIPF